jgi:UDP-4-amino-4,6-dideoxy-L-N-acetyl-beta-L-altrosamine transaminase
MKHISYGAQYIDSQDLLAVKRSLKQNLITTGPNLSKFEKKNNNFLKSKYSVACSSGTAAIHLALLSLNLKEGATVIMPSINFISAFNLCKKLKLKIFLSDVDKYTGQMTPLLMEECIKKNRLKKVDVLITMFLGGFSENIVEFYNLKKKYKYKIVEDACHAYGSSYIIKKKIYNVGECKHSDISTFSFHPLKTITTGEGGLITTNSKIYNDRLKSFRAHGIKRSSQYHWKYDVIENGLNYRISEMNCALGLSQLKKIKKFILKRKKIYNLYVKELNKDNLPIKFPDYSKNTFSSYHLAILHINFDKLKKKKDDFLKFMIKKNIMIQYHYIPIYKFKIAKKIKQKFKNSEIYYKNSISLPIHYNLSINDQKKVIKEIQIFLNKR